VLAWAPGHAPGQARPQKEHGNEKLRPTGLAGDRRLGLVKRSAALRAAATGVHSDALTADSASRQIAALGRFQPGARHPVTTVRHGAKLLRQFPCTTKRSAAPSRRLWLMLTYGCAKKARRAGPCQRGRGGADGALSEAHWTERSSRVVSRADSAVHHQRRPPFMQQLTRLGCAPPV
jgi:hypothetical protein